jgi:hypothetical protein
MARYYFDLRDGDELAVDDEGFELPDLEAVQREAVLSLCDGTRDAVEKATRVLTNMAIEVRDDVGPVMQVMFRFQPFRRN